MDIPAAGFPPRVTPPAKPLGAFAFAGAFLRKPLEAIPRAAYEEDIGPVSASRSRGIWITAPSLVKRVLLDERERFGKTVQIRLFRPLLGKGMLTTEGADWKWQRQAAAPMFRPAELHGFVPAFVRAAERMLDRWRASGEGVQPIDQEMSHVTFDVVSETLLPSADEATTREFQRSVQALQRFGGWDILYAYLRLPVWMPRRAGMEKLRAMRWLRQAVRALVADRRRQQSQPDDLVHRLMLGRDPETGRAMDDEQLADNLLTFYLAGHDTTAKALTWTLYLLARYPQWAQMLREEIERVTGGAPVAAGHIQNLVLVEQVLKESMRLYPPVPVMSRQALGDASLGGMQLRSGMSILIPIYAMHRHVRRWARPDEFDPARFALEEEARIPRYQYMPFGAGPRVCIGMSFAMIEATAILATIVRSCRLELAHEREPAPVAGVTLMPREGLRLRVRFCSPAAR